MMKYTFILTLLTVLLFGTGCSEPGKKPTATVGESNTLTTAHPKLIKTIGSPKYGNVQCSLQDKEGNLWFGTTENGLYKYDGKSFNRFLVADGLRSNNIWSLLEDKKGRIFIGTDSGLCVYDARLPVPDGEDGNDKSGGRKPFTAIQIPLRKNLPPNKFRNTHEVFSIIQDKRGKIWFATIDGVYVYDGKSFTPFIIDEDAMGYMSSNNNAEKMLEDNAGNIWFGGRGTHGVYRYDGKSVINIKSEELFQEGPKPKAHDWAWPQLQDKNGYIWFSNWGGAYRYDPSANPGTGSKSFKRFTKKDGLPGGVTRIIEDKNGNLWFGGDAGAGLSRYDDKSLPAGQAGFTRFTTKDGLLNYSIWSILEDKTGNIWVGTRETALYRYDGKTFITYSEYKQ